MKKIAFLFATAILTYGAQAQITKGTVSLTGTMGYTQQKSNPDKENENRTPENYNYTLAPSIGIFVKDNLEIGASVYLNRHKAESSSFQRSYSGNYTSTQFSDGKGKNFRVYARQYKFLTERFAAHGTLSAGFGNTETDYVYTSSNLPYYYHSNKQSVKISDYSVGLSPGLTFFASDKVGLSAYLGALRYSRSDIESMRESSLIGQPEPQLSENSYKSNVLQLDFSSMNLNFGLTYFIGK